MNASTSESEPWVGRVYLEGFEDGTYTVILVVSEPDESGIMDTIDIHTRSVYRDYDTVNMLSTLTERIA